MNWLDSKSFKSRARKPRQHFVLRCDELDARVLPAVTATFAPGTGILSVLGDSLDNTITVSRNAAGNILVNGGAVTVQGGSPTVANTATIQVFGQGGNDKIAFDEANGALPKGLLFGGAGNDILTGGSGGDQLLGQAGNDILLGKGGNDFLFGGDDNDVLTGGDADDQVFGQAGNDRMIWNPGDDTDLNEGGDGSDTVEVNGGNGAEEFTLTPNGTRVRFDRVTPAPFSIDIGTSENLVLNANGGDDTFTGSNGLAGLIKIAVDGGTGNDTMTGGDGNDQLSGGDGDDLVRGGRGTDVAFLGAGDDTFEWNPGEGSDVVEGQAGADTLLFNGSNANEKIAISANGVRTRLTRDVGNINMDVNDVETVTVNAFAGVDAITVNDLTPTDVTQVNLNLATDGQADTVTVKGSIANNSISIAGAGDAYTVSGLKASVSVTGSEGANDKLTVEGLGGNDSINGSGLPSGVVRLTVDGGVGNDSLTGSLGEDVLLGSDGNDLVAGNRGNDLALLGAGNDVFVWNPGDGNDVVEGQDGVDELLFNGANIAERIDISANGQRVRFTRDVANITMDMNDVEAITFNALGGADAITVNDLTGTDVSRVNLNLAAGGVGDGAADSVIVNGTNGANTIAVAGSGDAFAVTGLKATVVVDGSEAANDGLFVNALGGNDTVNADALPSGVVQLTVDGGTGNDRIIGSQGADRLLGNDGNDVVDANAGDDTVFLGAGDDLFVWNPGDGRDILEGQDGKDTMRFNGSAANENFDISANGGRIRFLRDVGGVILDLNDVEIFDIRALGGVDSIVVNDLSGTDATDVNVNLLGADGLIDGKTDSVIVNGTAGDDTVAIGGTPTTGVTVTGLAASVRITGIEGSRDLLTVNALAGADILNASHLSANTIGLTLNGGANDDEIVGSPGKDLVNGGTGSDLALLGAGNDTFVWNPGDGSDTLEGQAGFDTMLFNGANINEKIDISANGRRARFTRDVANITMDLSGIETVTFNALGGADTITVNDLTGTDVHHVILNLAAPGTTGDGAADSVIVNGSNRNDSFSVNGGAKGVAVFSANTSVTITGSEVANDRLTINALGGNDRVDASALAAGLIQLTIDGGDGNDVLLGSAGVDSIIGGAGNDVLMGNGGIDILNGAPGNDVVIQ